MNDERHAGRALPVREPWFEVRQIDSAITLISEPYVHEVIRSNIWHVRGDDRDLIVDTGLGIASLVQSLPEMFSAGTVAVATHSHYDHIGGMHEFSERAVHRLEPRSNDSALFSSLIVPSTKVDGDGTLLLSALPQDGYDPAAYRVPEIEPTRTLDEGDAVNLGNRSFMTLHLPGHSPGSIGLWEEATGVLFSGDAIYDGQLFDALPGSNITDYLATMKRLRELPVSVVHSGHGASFGRERLVELADAYLRTREP